MAEQNKIVAEYVAEVARLAKTGAFIFALTLALLGNLDAYAESDLDAYLRGKVFRMWVNDDADESDSQDDPVDIPKQSNADCNDDHVNGRRDLVDFFPMWLNISSFAPWLSGGQVGVGLMHPDAAVNVVWTSLANLEAGKFHREDVGGCGPNLNQNAWEATVTRITANGVNVPQSIIDMIRTNSFFGLFDERGLYGTNGSVLAMQPHVRRHALADGIPAESYVAGANRIEAFGDVRNVPMPNVATNAWTALYGIPRENEEGELWRHSDIKNRPYQVVRDVFLSIIEKGNLR